MGVNSTTLSGNISREPELRATASGATVLQFGLAFSNRAKNKNGEWENVPSFIDCVIFGARADALSRHLHKGTKITVQGKLRWSQWERNGEKRSKIELAVEELDLMAAPKPENSAYKAPYVDGSAPYPQYGNAGAYDEDIPF